VLAFGRAAHWHPLRGIAHLAGLNFFGLVEFLSANLLMPLSATARQRLPGMAYRKTDARRRAERPVA